MTRIFYYKLVSDDGGAPCTWGDRRSLAICKPIVRGSAEIEDMILGFAGKTLNADNRLIYGACVTEKLTNGAYYKDKKWWERPDCIYRWSGEHYRIAPNPYHCSNEIEHDLGHSPAYDRANVLLSEDFRYFGGGFPEDFKHESPALTSALSRLMRGHRINHPAFV